MLQIAPEEFERYVSRALDGLPAEVGGLMRNVAVVVEDEPPEDEPDLLGLYEGVPLTERGWDYGGALPDLIRVFRNPICEICATPDEVVEEVRITVIHEVAHHFGIDDEHLDELGWS